MLFDRQNKDWGVGGEMSYCHHCYIFSTVAYKGHAGFFCFLDIYNRFVGCSVSVVRLKENIRNVSTVVETCRKERKAQCPLWATVAMCL